jgi:hypothetical protein
MFQTFFCSICSQTSAQSNVFHVLLSDIISTFLKNLFVIVKKLSSSSDNSNKFITKSMMTVCRENVAIHMSFISSYEECRLI